MFGWTGTILRVDLTKGKVTREATDIKTAHDYIGARGLGGKIITDELDPKTDALSPDNKLIFAPGPLTGTFAPSAGRYEVITKGPLNNVIACSNSGGAFGPELKYAGLRRRHRRGQGGQAVVPVDQRRQGGDPRRRVDLGPRHAGHDRSGARRDRRRRQGGLHRAGRRASLAHRQHHERDAPRRRPHRRRRRHGFQEPQGGRRLRHRLRPGRRPRPLQGRRHDVPEAHPGAPRRRRRPQGLRHQRARQHPQPDGRAAHAQLPGRLLPHRRQDRRRVAGGEAAAALQGLLQLHHQLRPGLQGRQPRLQGLRRRARVRDRLVVRRRLRHRRPRRHHQGQLPLQRVRDRHHLHGVDRGLRDGALREGRHHGQGHRRHPAHVRQRRGHGRDGAQGRGGRGLRRQARAGLVPPGRELRSPRAAP